MTIPLAALALVVSSTAAPTLELSPEVRAWHREAVLWEGAARECMVDLDLARAERRAAREALSRCETAETRCVAPASRRGAVGALLSGVGIGGGIASGIVAGAICEDSGCRLGAGGLAAGLVIAGILGLIL